jgi:hypothetical protein
MKPLALMLCAAATFFPSVVALSAPTQETLPAAVLSKPQVSTLGDMIALSMTQLVQVVRANESWTFSADVIGSYDREASKIQVSVYGTRTSVDEAKAGLEYFRAKIFPVLAAQIAKTYRVTLTESDLTLAYFNRAQNFREIVRREANKYVVNE